MPAILPVLRTAPPPPPPFPNGSRVLLASCPFGEPGIVKATKRGRVHVSWPGLHMIGKHRSDALVAV